MPSPFTHLRLAERVIREPQLPQDQRALLSENRGAYLFGHTAPDFVSRTGRSREESHFFRVPMNDRRPAHLRALQEHSILRPDAITDPRMRSFVAGYFCHLWVDQLWISNLFEPYFGIDVERGTFRERLLDHNLLRAHIDLRDEAMLTPEVSSHLAGLRPGRWLPFASPPELREWLDHLTEQLRPNGRSKTIEVFSDKSGVPPSTFANRLSSEQAMRETVFSHLPDGILSGFEALAVKGCCDLTAWYLGGANKADLSVNQHFTEDMILGASSGAKAHYAID